MFLIFQGQTEFLDLLSVIIPLNFKTHIFKKDNKKTWNLWVPCLQKEKC